VKKYKLGEHEIIIVKVEDKISMEKSEKIREFENRFS
jgi:hypothetical protein